MDGVSYLLVWFVSTVSQDSRAFFFFFASCGCGGELERVGAASFQLCGVWEGGPELPPVGQGTVSVEGRAFLEIFWKVCLLFCGLDG